jgi:hypothetical protein
MVSGRTQVQQPCGPRLLIAMPGKGVGERLNRLHALDPAARHDGYQGYEEKPPRFGRGHAQAGGLMYGLAHARRRLSRRAARLAA